MLDRLREGTRPTKENPADVPQEPGPRDRTDRLFFHRGINGKGWGKTTATFNVPASTPGYLAGALLHHAGVVFDLNLGLLTIHRATNPVELLQGPWQP